jgi:hypothetical protein
MGKLDFLKYQKLFENEVICKGVAEGLIGKITPINVRSGRLSYTSYAKRLGAKIDSDLSFGIDYYGYLKRSKGLIDSIDLRKELIRNRQIKSIQTNVVFFASLKIETIADITSSQYLKGGFPEFKKIILHWRGFEKRKKTSRKQDAKGEDRRVAMQRT